MGLGLNIFFFGISLLVLSISGGYATNGSIRITHISPSWKDNKKLKDAHSKLTLAAVITWITVALILLAAILYIAFGMEETAGLFDNVVVYGLLFLSLIATAFVGVLSAIAAADISNAKVENDDLAHRQATIAAVLAIIGFVAILVTLIIKFFHKPKKKKVDNGDSKNKLYSLLYGGNGKSELAGEGSGGGGGIGSILSGVGGSGSGSELGELAEME